MGPKNPASPDNSAAIGRWLVWLPIQFIAPTNLISTSRRNGKSAGLELKTHAVSPRCDGQIVTKVVSISRRIERLADSLLRSAYAVKKLKLEHAVMLAVMSAATRKMSSSQSTDVTERCLASIGHTLRVTVAY